MNKSENIIKNITNTVSNNKPANIPTIKTNNNDNYNNRLKDMINKNKPQPSFSGEKKNNNINNLAKMIKQKSSNSQVKTIKKIIIT